MDNDIIEFLKQGMKGTAALRAEFGKYPRKRMHLLLESGAVEKLKEGGLVKWKLTFEGESDAEELKLALKKNMELLEENDAIVQFVADAPAPIFEKTPPNPSEKLSYGFDDQPKPKKKWWKREKN